MAGVNYNDARFQEVEKEKNQAINKTENTYNEMINSSNSYYQQQIDATKEYGNTQAELQNQQTDFAIEKVNQAKDQAQKDYQKEQRGAYTDYQKQTNQYGVNAELQAQSGLQNSGYAQSAKVSAYNTYQNRYTAARESYNQAVLNYDNSIKEAQLSNNSALANIAYQTLQTQLELSLQGFQYKNTLLLQKTEALNNQEDRYYNRYQNVLSQINTENSLAEQIRQYNESMAFQKQQAAQQQSNWEKQYALSKASASRSSSGGSSSKSSSSGSSATLTNSGSKASSSSSSSSGKLSSGGESLYKVLSYMSNRKDNATTRNANINQVNIAYNNGKINENDVKTIFQKLGYE